MRMGISIISIGFAIYLYINTHNQLIENQLVIPRLQKELKEILAENDRLQFEIDRFEAPAHLMKLAEKPEFSHLKTAHEIIVIE